MFGPVRQMVAAGFAADFAGATELQLGYYASALVNNKVRAGDTIVFYRAVVAPECPGVAVDWGDNSSIDFYVPGEDRSVVLTHTYRYESLTRTVLITNTLSEFYPSNAELGAVGPDISYTTHSGAEKLAYVVTLGSRIENRTLSIGLFANTGLVEMPAAYSLPGLSSLAPGVKCVPALCFADCSWLSSTRSIAGAKVIDVAAFKGCSMLDANAFTALAPGGSVVHIGARAFSGCTHMTSLSWLGNGTLTRNSASTLFGKALTAFSDAEIAAVSADLGAAGNRNRINYFSFPLGAYAFAGCTALSDISGLAFSSGAILPGTFSGCSSLVTVPSAVSSCEFGLMVHGSYPDAYTFRAPTTEMLSTADRYSCRNGGVTRVVEALFVSEEWGAFSGTSISAAAGPGAGSSATAIPTREFANCSGGFTSMVLPSTLVRIGREAFSGSAVRDLTFIGKNKLAVQGIRNLDGLCCVGYSALTYPFGLASGAVIHCTDGDLTV